MKLLLSNFKGYYKQLILGPTFKLAEAVLELFIPVIMANIIDIGIKNNDINYIISRGALMLLLGAIGLVFAVICQYFAAVCAFGFGKSLRKQVFRHVFSLSQSIHSSIGTDTLITRISNDVTHVQTGINIAIRLAVRVPFLIIGSAIMALYINFQIGILFVLFIPLILSIIYLIMRKSVPLFTAVQKNQDSVSLMVGENLSGARVIRAFSKGQSEVAQLNGAYNDLTKATISARKISALLNPIVYALVNGAIVIILWVGGINVNIGSMEQGQVFALVNYMTQTLLALLVLGKVVSICTKAITSAIRVNDILKMTTDMEQPIQSEEEKNTSECIKFENVSFMYKGGGDKAIENISFVINKGETLGIIGGTGCGKTTLVHLILRQYDATEGLIEVNGTNVQNYTLKDLKSKIAIVPQKTTLFSTTIENNMLIANKNATQQEIYDALEWAQAKQFVQQKELKLNTIIVQGGKNLSGGQKQRLTIARALLAKSPILIMDDCTSALDFTTEANLRKALSENLKDTTVVMISQRAGGIMHADKILVMDDGKAMGFGTHNELLNTCEVYKEICKSQNLT